MNGLRKHEGLTLIELVVVIALISVVVGFAVPGFAGLVERSHRQTTISSMVNLFNVSRTAAVQQQVPVTICPLDPADAKCTRDWSLPVTAFTDPLRQRQLTSSTEVVLVKTAPSRGRLIGGTGIRRYFGFNADGMAAGAIGNVTWCPDDRDASKAVQLRINWGGRVVRARDTDGDGIAEDSRGAPLVCS
ncbi:GspH/FimT family pseudopilin [Marinobacter salicampi]|uniref:GspH/FimT family pseudopilin n=1 Tax=Marinobacter salicampi TaxID=435907 RepID=UPI00140C5210|nr:GspH/FimT family pseudopilin [Marinobacter salicampi]